MRAVKVSSYGRSLEVSKGKDWICVKVQGKGEGGFRLVFLNSAQAKKLGAALLKAAK